MIHRDVKPSNCFLDDEGRVKIGDFGLSKSLVATCSFRRRASSWGRFCSHRPSRFAASRSISRPMCTPSPPRSTYLLTGHAPFEAGDAAATLARIVSDPPKPLRSLRPEVPKRLDAIVLRGLERNRQRRWRNLQEFRAALARYFPGARPAAKRGVRVAALLLDTLLFLPLDVFHETFILATWLGFASEAWQARLVNVLVAHLPLLIYFTLTEGLCGCSLGKWLLRLRVIGSTVEPPDVARAGLRSLLFIGLIYVPAAAIDVIYAAFAVDDFRIWDALYLLAFGIGLLLVFSTARVRNGYRGVHEWASGTCVIALGWPVRDSVLKRLTTGQTLQLTGPTDNLPQQAGPYAIRGAIAWNGRVGTLLAEDTSLGRSVWIDVRSASQPLEPARRA